MSTTGQLTYYDPLAVFVDVYSDPTFAQDVAPALDCRTLDALVALLESRGEPEAAARWLAGRFIGCGDPPCSADLDPLAVFVDVCSDPAFVEDVVFVLNCREVNVLVALLESRDRPDAAARWLDGHRRDCDDPRRH